MRSKTLFIGLGVVIGILLTSTALVLAGSLDPASGPTDAGSQMYTLEQVYNRVNDGTAATKMTTFTEPGAGPAGAMYTLDQLYALVGERARVPKTGQTTSYATGDDGDLEKGVDWPSTRFTDNGNGTVTDNLTGLIWLKSANCFGARNWATALTDCNSLANGSCGLTDGSSAGDWRLANVNELLSLIDRSHYGPALPSGHPFANVQTMNSYWSSTTFTLGTAWAWYVHLGGYVGNNEKTTTSYYVWPVRGGQ
ncbi:MAG: DUF1566 domain-containing protein [Chloroflexi bacterium]|nr:DUF1566 domain-containing protein [Chloroflexota bacterium]MBU1747060.1 DUF1566 domain-containing protein [Chloroflexota bacterium]